jgi:Eco57I restriction-modification methylase
MVADARKIEHAIKRVRDQSSFLQEFLADALGWPIDRDVVRIEDIAYEWTEDELRAAGLNEKIVGGRAYQIVLPNNPWGIFIVEFKNPEVVNAGRGMTGVLRNILHGLTIKKRGSADPRLARFNSNNLLFICNHKYESYRFAHFKISDDSSTKPVMASFGWGPDDAQAVRTLCEFNLNSLAWPDREPSDQERWIATWGAAFDVEAVTRRFYEDYAKVFGRVEAAVKQSADLEKQDLRTFTQSLFNRLMFLRFIERKGWLRFEGQKGTRYLEAVMAAGPKGRTSIYRSRLRPLFFEGLSGERKEASDVYGAVPYLNGGLFEQADLDERVQDIPDEAVRSVIGAEGLFYRYNFTVEESTPLDVEVAVDPEMLGKVFEELVTGRHESGAYYTPRQVVSFMCRETLKGHLADRTSAPSASIKRLVDEHVVDGLNETHAQQIVQALDSIKAVDPACGSGAYLLGLLQELIAIRRSLQSEKLVTDPTFLYRLKLHTISNNLYGVDIDPLATEIAKLRLWLSLAVEADKPVPLPNLDFKIETGDSLLGPNPRQLPGLFRELIHDLAARLQEMKRQYLDARGQVKKKIKADIDRAEAELAKSMNVQLSKREVDWRIHFADVFGGNNGFDIVLANPPYVSALEFRRTRTDEEREAIRSRFEAATGAWDLYVPFFERGLQLLRDGGYLAYISPNKYLSASYAKSLRSLIRRTASFRQLVDLSRFPVFASASVYPVLTFLRSARDEAQIFCRLPQDLTQDSADPATFRLVTVAQHMLDLLPDQLWGFLLSDRLETLVRLLANTTTMVNVAEVSATTTAAEADEYGNHLRDDQAGRQFRIVNTGTLDPYEARWGAHQMTHKGRKLLHPTIEPRHLSANRRRLYGEPKVLFAKMGKCCEAFFDSEGQFGGLNINCISRPRGQWRLAFLCGYCNSSVFMFFYNQLFGALRMAGGYYQFQSPQLRAMPVPSASPAQQESIGRLVLTLQGTIADTPNSSPVQGLTDQIDQSFAELFGLTLTESRALGNEMPQVPVDEAAAIAE